MAVKIILGAYIFYNFLLYGSLGFEIPQDGSSLQASFHIKEPAIQGKKYISIFISLSEQET